VPTIKDKDAAPPAEMSGPKAKAFVKFWLGECSDALKREKNYRKLGQESVNLYEAKTPDTTPFAILYSNVETLTPAVYNARPIPIVMRRYKDADPVGKAVADVATRSLKFLIDTESVDYDTFDDLIASAVLDGVVTNRGLTRFRYSENTNTSYMPECVYGEAVRWDKFFHGYARTWKKVPWIGFQWDMSKDELKKNFPKISFDEKALDKAEDDNEKAENKDELTGVKVFPVYEIWDKKSRKLLFFSPCHTDAPLKIVDDPLKLSTFFPIPKPMNFMRKITTLIPTPLYQQYRSQAAELNELTRRLKAIVKAIKFRGFYNSTVEGIEKVLEAEDNELIPAENMQALGENPSVEKTIWTVPVNELVQTAQALYQQREQCKQTIYEITGISDILRGASVASETATAQNIKNQWGTLRLKKMQKEVQRYCREALAIMLEIAASQFEQQTFQQTFQQMTGLMFLKEEEKAKLTQLKQQFEQQVAMAKQAGQQPPTMPPIPPEIMQAYMSPTWEQIMSVLRNDTALHYKTDIETNSTIDAEAAQDKQDISELMNAMSQFLNGVAPLVEKGAMSIEVAKQMLLVVCRRFNFGSQIEDALNAMKEPEPQKDPAAEQKAEQAKMEAQLAAQEAQARMAELKMEAQIKQSEHQMKMEEMQVEQQIRQEELALKQAELQIQKAGLRMKAEFAEHQHSMRMKQAAQKKETTSA
jgi:hypothetical protein